MAEQFSRTELLLGTEAIDKLQNSRVAVFGVGGVGGYVAEALVRSGIGSIDIIDKDIVSESNINRQIIALHSTIGKSKVDVLNERLLDINPKLNVKKYNCFFLPDNADDFDFSQYDYVVDAVDTVTAKLSIIQCAKKVGTKVISSMGAGNKLNPFAFKISDIKNTKVCPLAKVMRRELKKREIEDVKVIYSEEIPIKNNEYDMEIGKAVPGSIAFIPSVVGLMLASEVIKDLVNSRA